MPTTHTVSYSEIDTFRQCPFKWDLAYRNRWTKPAEEGSALSRGTLFHQVMEAHYRGIQKGLPAGEIGQDVGALLCEKDGTQTEQQGLVQWMYEGYVGLYGFDHEWEIVAVEYANEFWLPTDRGGRSGFKIKVKIDLIVRHASTGKIWIIDHKSCKDLPTQKMLEFDDQFGLYTWGLRKLGKPIMGSIHNAARTLRYKDPNKVQPLDERFRRTLLYRTDEELDEIAVEAYRTARRAWGTREGAAERNTNPDTCNWRCDYSESCLGARKGGDLVHMLETRGYIQDFTRH